MAIQHFDCKGFGQIEPSQVWFTRAGMSESQCYLDEEKFAANFPMLPSEVRDNKIYAENGAFLMIDKQNKTATIPNAAMSKLGYKMGINYSTEKLYNSLTPGRRNFAMIAGEYLPRIGFVEPGMRICTNTVCWDDTAEAFAGITDSKEFYDKVKELLKTEPNTPIYAFVIDNGDLDPTEAPNGKLVIGAKPEDAIGNVYAIVTQAYTNADTTLSFKIMFIDKPEA